MSPVGPAPRMTTGRTRALTGRPEQRRGSRRRAAASRAGANVRTVAVAQVGDEGAGQQDQQTRAGQDAERRHDQAERDAEGTGDLEGADAPVGVDREPCCAASARIGVSARILAAPSARKADRDEQRGDERGRAGMVLSLVEVVAVGFGDRQLPADGVAVQGPDGGLVGPRGDGDGRDDGRPRSRV